jgi:hypothetical protein
MCDVQRWPAGPAVLLQRHWIAVMPVFPFRGVPVTCERNSSPRQNRCPVPSLVLINHRFSRILTSRRLLLCRLKRVITLGEVVENWQSLKTKICHVLMDQRFMSLGRREA